MYSATVKLIYRQHDNNYQLASVVKTFVNKSQEAVYDYIKYYTLAFGICDVEMISEGETQWAEINLFKH